mgnify:CR=1 FL=1
MNPDIIVDYAPRRRYSPGRRSVELQPQSRDWRLALDLGLSALVFGTMLLQYGAS